MSLRAAVTRCVLTSCRAKLNTTLSPSHQCQQRRHSIGQKLLGFYQRLWPAAAALKPPYQHVCQVGDPVLRSPAIEVDVNRIKSMEVQRLIVALVAGLRRTRAVGLSATQLGVGRRVFVVEFTQQHLENYAPAMRARREQTLVPLRVLVNPTMRVVDETRLVFNEGCLSVAGFSAQVPRFREVEVSAYDADGEPFTWCVSGWAARIVQHEMDHLDGKLYIDRMDRLTFQYDEWARVNVRGKL
ncbi:PREDICTED: peptide deformylase, mitochondrial-like [Priapulus caudatus]|uniref:Peptide deformylase n=1 Tax=Priapulus caudatus TaxID=37621 RepID=A0ABM1ECP9_PRICU|nr:PREDICTED: peptide deformylase, mitochondrial-like [Priapulus caudatus]